MVDKLESVLFAGFLGLLVWAPIPFASNRPWAAALLFIWVNLLFLGWLTLYFFRRVRIRHHVWDLARWPLLILCLVQFWVFLQLIPLPSEMLAVLSPRAVQWRPAAGSIPISLDTQATVLHLFKGMTLTIGFFLALAFVNSPARVKLLLQLLVFSGTLQALYGSLMVLSGWEWGFFVEKYASRGSATGTFVNRNHLAGYLVMCLSAGIGLLLSQLSQESSASWRDYLRRMLKLLLSPKIRLRIYLAIMVVGLVLTRSRMGNISFFVALSVAGVLALASGRHFSWKVAAFLGSLFLVDALILGNWFGFEKLAQRIQDTDVATEQRVASSEYALDMAADFPWTGSGGGTFYGLFPNYQTETLDGFHTHAHNDYLQFAAELGLPAALLLACFCVLGLWHGWRVQKDRHQPLYRGAGFAVVMSTVWLALHATADFNLQIPANALIFVILLSLGPICRALPGKPG